MPTPRFFLLYQQTANNSEHPKSSRDQHEHMKVAQKLPDSPSDEALFPFETAHKRANDSATQSAISLTLAFTN